MRHLNSSFQHRGLRALPLFLAALCLLAAGQGLASSDNLTINEGPDASPNPAVEGQDVSFFVSASGKSTRGYLWDFGDGSTDESPLGTDTFSSILHSYTSAGTYKVTITVFHGPSQQDKRYTVSKTLEVTINPYDGPLAAFTVNTDEGPAPLTVNFDGSGSYDPLGGALINYDWDFGDGTTATTTVPTTSHTYTTAGPYTPTLIVENDSFLLSDAFGKPLNVTDGRTGDGDLFTSKAAVKLNLASTNGDAATISANVNPSGFPDDLSGAMVSLTINGQEVGPATSAAGARSGARASRARAFSFLPLLGSDGRLSLRLSGANLRAAFDVDPADEGEETKRVAFEAEITGISADRPVVRGIIEQDFNIQPNKRASGAFNFLTLGTRTGAFKSLKTGAVESRTSAGSYLFSATGPVVAELNTPLNPTGDVTLTIGDSSGSAFETIVIPLAAFVTKGSGGTSIVDYDPNSSSPVAEIKKFQINNAKKKFILQTNELSNTGLPASGTGGTTFDLPIVIDCPTATGTFTLTTSIELKRKDASQGSWSR